LLAKELGWVDYGGKHCENVFTRFYQGYILPVKFNIDKRKAHLSTLVFSGQLTREEALAELAQPPYDLQTMRDDYEYVAKKLGFSMEEFDRVLTQPNRDHVEFGDETKIENLLYGILKTIKPIKPVVKWLLK